MSSEGSNSASQVTGAPLELPPIQLYRLPPSAEEQQAAATAELAAAVTRLSEELRIQRESLMAGTSALRESREHRADAQPGPAPATSTTYLGRRDAAKYCSLSTRAFDAHVRPYLRDHGWARHPQFSRAEIDEVRVRTATAPRREVPQPAVSITTALRRSSKASEMLRKLRSEPE
jgi:hypothetical protein